MTTLGSSGWAQDGAAPSNSGAAAGELLSPYAYIGNREYTELVARLAWFYGRRAGIYLSRENYRNERRV